MARSSSGRKPSFQGGSMGSIPIRAAGSNCAIVVKPGILHSGEKYVNHLKTTSRQK